MNDQNKQRATLKTETTKKQHQNSWISQDGLKKTLFGDIQKNELQPEEYDQKQTSSLLSAKSWVNWPKF